MQQIPTAEGFDLSPEDEKLYQESVKNIKELSKNEEMRRLACTSIPNTAPNDDPESQEERENTMLQSWKGYTDDDWRL